MQALASRLWTPQSKQHPGQLTWSACYAEDADRSPVALWEDDGRPVAWCWAESDDFVEVCVDPERPELVAAVAAWATERTDGAVRTWVLVTEEPLTDGLVSAGWSLSREAPWMTHHTLDLALLVDVPDVAGYRLRAVRPGEAARRAGVHRAAWSPTSRVTAAAYERLTATPPYDPRLDWVAITDAGEWVASCCVWLDRETGCALVEPVGAVEAHRRRGLASAVSLAALHAARDAGATTGLVCPRGDDDYPAPRAVYQGIGFLPGPRTIAFTSS